MKYEETIIQLGNRNNGYVKRSDVIGEGIPSVYLSRMVKKGMLTHFSCGLYGVEKCLRDPYFIFQNSYPKFIFSFISAIYLLGLGDIQPNYLEVTGPKNYRPFGYKTRKDIIHTNVNMDVYNLGIIRIKTEQGNTVLCYDLERTVCDLIRYRNKIENEIFIKALHRYREKKEKNFRHLSEYARILHIEDEVNSLMEVVLDDEER